jgi:hypothetical protein
MGFVPLFIRGICKNFELKHSLVQKSKSMGASTNSCTFYFLSLYNNLTDIGNAHISNGLTSQMFFYN